MAKERPILFSAPMVRALLEGRKTVTRRIVKKPERLQGMVHGEEGAWCPYGQPGDRLWVRETWGCTEADRPGVPGGRKPREGDDVRFSADPGTTYQWRGGRLPWRPSIHMPRWASRLSLEITGVKVERLQDITEEGAIAEGIERINDLPVNPLDFVACWKDYTGSRPYWNSPIDSFHSLWESINGAESWKSNPFVWAVSFTRLVTP